MRPRQRNLGCALAQSLRSLSITALLVLSRSALAHKTFGGNVLASSFPTYSPQHSTPRPLTSSRKLAQFTNRGTQQNNGTSDSLYLFGFFASFVQLVILYFCCRRRSRETARLLAAHGTTAQTQIHVDVTPDPPIAAVIDRPKVKVITYTHGTPLYTGPLKSSTSQRSDTTVTLQVQPSDDPVSQEHVSIEMSVPSSKSGKDATPVDDSLLVSTDLEAMCPVCLLAYEDGDQLGVLPCGHKFHKGCIDEWFEQHATCPICRKGAD